MRKSERKWTKISVCLLALVLLLCLWRMMGTHRDYSSALAANWGIFLPEGCEVAYEKDTGAEWFGEGCRYHAFICEDSAAVERLLPWSDSRYTNTATGWLDMIEVPDVQRPAFENCASHHLRQNEDEALFLWDAEKGMLYVIESFW